MVFEDPTARRWRRAVVIAGVAAAALGAVLALSVALGLTVPPLPAVSEQLPARVPGLVASRVMPLNGEAATGGAAAAKAPVRPAYAATRPLGMDDPFLATAFVVQADRRSVIALESRLPDLDIVFPDWFRFDTADGAVVETIDADVLALLRSGQALVMPRVSNVDADERWRPDVFRALARDPEARWELIGQLLNRTQAAGGQGLNVDIEGLAAEDATLFLEWLGDLTKRFHEAGLYVTVDLPVRGDAYDYEVIGRLVDAVVVMGYDEHFASGQAGPIASRDWFSAAIDELTHRVPVDKLIVGLGAYGYDWRVGSSEPARVLGFAEAMSLAGEFGAWVETDGTALNSTFAYTDYDGVGHQVWLLDAVSAWNQMALVREWGARGVALWRLGLEEPTLWRFFAGDEGAAPEDLASVESWDGIVRAGEGQLLRVTDLPADGERSLSVDRGIIDHAAYARLPSYFVVGNYGRAAEKQVALTFDDGPDREWTPQVLDLLRRHGVPATFFVVGNRVARMPDLLRRALAEGHVIGNHTYGHPNLIYSSDLSIQSELNSTQRLIEAATGHQTVLFRAPYYIDTAPTLPEELRPLFTVTRLGYVVAGADIDSRDYNRPGVEAIVDNVLAGVAPGGVHVVTLHDAGGDRSQTVAAVDRLIPLLKARGFTFVTLDTVLGLPRAAVMPPAPAAEAPLAAGQSLLARLGQLAWLAIAALFVVATLISATRLVFLLAVIWRDRGRARPARPDFTPPVLVLVPAYNEAKVIQATVQGILASDYPDLRVLVIDDGSTDDTAARVREAMAADGRVEVVRTPNGGKHAALNLGFRLAREEVIVTVDADTILLPHTVRQLVAPFVDPTVSAVCGNVRVGNVGNLLTASQDVEYVTSQSFDRRAFDVLNAVPVVPGATGAWRRSAVLAAGGYSGHTLTEDADLTVSVLANGGRIVFAPWATSITEAPASARALFRQRFRWTYGALQTVWKHRQRLGRGRVGWITLPHILVFQLVFPLVSPIGDLAALACLLRGDYQALALAYLLFTTLDLVASGVAFWLDDRSPRTLWVVFLQRFYYRQFMYVVTYRAVIEAIHGRRHGWNKLERKATVAGSATTSAPAA